MRKGYAAEQYYGKPADAIEEVDSVVMEEGGKAEVDKDSKDKTHKAVPLKSRDYNKEAYELRESFEKKIDFVTDLWRQIESTEVADLPLVEFRRHVLEILNNLDKIIPNLSGLIRECENLMKEIAEVSIALESEDIKRQKDEDISIDLSISLEQKSVDLRRELIDRLNDKDFEFVHNCVAFVSGIVLKRTKIESLRHLPDQKDRVLAGADLCRYLEAFNFESEYGYDSKYSVDNNENVKRLIEFLQKKVLAGENIFDFIEIDAYDICFYLDREDFDKIYINKANEQKGGGKKITIYGAHFKRTPIIILAKNDKDRSTEDVGKTKVHEQGHNVVGITTNLDGMDIHNTVYRKEFVGELRNTGAVFKQLFEKGDKEGAKIVAVGYMETAIHKLNGEISADAKNIIRGYPKTFINYILNLIDSLNEYVLESKSETSKNIVEAETKNAFLQIVEEEIVKLKSKTVDLVVKMVTYAYIARKHGLEDEFCSALVLMPDSEKYLRRVLEIKLGDKFDIESVKSEINPDEVFAGAPGWIRDVARKYFGPNIVV